ncbi:uncharacterized protein EMH_0069650 [Eimeria mitis]|uniref:CCHC-type domain-containing protein n=1 Tax=Eimeria mitis TaxID=44415 RepID=U6K6F2_9EIME|nr:uncharacterized protein EMH_0069650 [Eimeria mitis]CDJ31782.1 hypothetical protein EMH_0069650 [Eimeria mitis]
MVKMLKKNTWTGNYSEYITRFTDIVALGTHTPPEELVLWFFTLIPPEIGERISAEGTRKFRDWHEAAVALRAWAEPLEAWRAARIKSLQEFMASDDEEAGMEGSVLTNGKTAPPVRKGGPAEEGNVRRCYECTGKGHFGRECPLRNGVPRRSGEICSKCEGKDNYARECVRPPRSPSGRQAGRDSGTDIAVAGSRLNGRA